MKPGPWVIVALVLLVLSVIMSVMDRSFLMPTYLAVLAIAVMVGSGESSPGRSSKFPTFSGRVRLELCQPAQDRKHKSSVRC